MSDVLNFIDTVKFKNQVRIENNHCLNYVRKGCVSTEDIVLTILVSYKWLRYLFEAKKNGLICDFIEVLNIYLADNYCSVKIKKGCTRIEGRLRRACGEVEKKFEGKNGSTYRKLAEKEMKIAVRADEVVTYTELEEELEKEKSKSQQLLIDNEILQNRCEELYSQMVQLEAKNKDVEQQQIRSLNEIEKLLKQNEQLQSYITKLGQDLEFENKSGKVTEVGDRQQRRKLKELKTRTEQALWFAKTFGLELESVSFSDVEGSSHCLNYSTNQEKKGYKDLPEDKKEKVKSVLFALDKFCVGEAAYHELTMTPGGESLPRSYLIKQCKEELNKLCHITRTPGEPLGAQLDFKTELETVIKSQINKGNINIDEEGFKLNIKISGDGAKMSNLTSFIVISFSVLNNEDEVMSSKGNHTVAVVKGQESYEVLQSACATIFGDVNKLVEKGKISCIDGKEVPVEFYLGGDYKFILLVLGMKTATSDFACIWCKIHKKFRYDMSKQQDYYWGDDIVRTQKDIQECAKKTQYSCQHQPLLNIKLENVVLDELHLMLRITDKLTKNLITEAVQWDEKENLDKPPCQRTDKRLQAVVRAIRSCGVTFDVWEKLDANGSGSGRYDFTSLMGPAKKLLLKLLPDKLHEVSKPETSNIVVQIWKDFDALYSLVGLKNPTDEQVTDFFEKARSWVLLFNSLGGRYKGFEKERVTPYMHAMVYHIPRFMANHRGIKKFTGQGVEKLNDDCRRIHLQRSNKWDAPKDILLVEKRIENLGDYERAPRKYRKQDTNYWERDIKESRSKRPRVCTELPVPESSIAVEIMSVEEIKANLNAKGIKTRLRSLKKLQNLLKNTLQNEQPYNTTM